MTSNENDPPEIWGRLIDCALCRLNALVDDDADVKIHDEWLTVDERLERENSRQQQAVLLYGVRQIYDLHIKIMILVMQLRGRILRPRPRHNSNHRQCYKLLDRFNLEEIGRW